MGHQIARVQLRVVLSLMDDVDDPRRGQPRLVVTTDHLTVLATMPGCKILLGGVVTLENVY